MVGYYKVGKNAIDKLGMEVYNIEDNIYHLCCPLIVQSKKLLAKELVDLYEALEIPIILYEDIKTFDFSICQKRLDYLNQFSKFLELNIGIELEEEKELGHLLRVGRYAKELASSLKLEKKEIHNIYIAALFHDIGKHLIPRKIIGKAGKLTNQEFEVIKTHCTLARDILGGFLEDDVLLMIESHHERLYGTGYPNGIIPSVGAQIIGIADSYDAMTAKRVYHNPEREEEAYQELQRCAKSKEEGGKGILYSPSLVEKFIKIQKKKKENKLFSVPIIKESK